MKLAGGYSAGAASDPTMANGSTAKLCTSMCLFGGVPKGEQAETLFSHGARDGLDVVVGTPGRCVYNPMVWRGAQPKRC